jgi:enoyl-CoA hydratase/carnithine racemase
VTVYRHLEVSESGGVVLLRLNRPEERNALNRALMTELTEFAREVRSRADVRAVVLSGAKGFFSAGADLAERSIDPERRPSMLELRGAMLIGPDMCKAWEDIEPVTLVAVEGYCVGGACALSLCCDFRIMGEGGMMRLPEVPLGMNMSWRSLPRLATLVGPSRAKRFTIFGDATDAKTLHDWGMVDELVPAGEAESTALAWARRLAELPPLPVRMSKEAINAAANANHHAASYMDRDQFLLTLNSKDLQEGIKAFFEKRKPRFEGD